VTDSPSRRISAPGPRAASRSAAAAHLRTLDVEWLVHPEDRGVGWFATLIDPDGNYVQLI